MWLDFGGIDLIFKVTTLWILTKVSLVNAVKNCVHIISLANGCNLTKLAQIHHHYGGKKSLDFGDLDLSFKVTTL